MLMCIEELILSIIINLLIKFFFVLIVMVFFGDIIRFPHCKHDLILPWKSDSEFGWSWIFFVFCFPCINSNWALNFVSVNYCSCLMRSCSWPADVCHLLLPVCRVCVARGIWHVLCSADAGQFWIVDERIFYVLLYVAVFDKMLHCNLVMFLYVAA